MGNPLNAKIGKILEVTSDLPKERIDELVQTAELNEQQGVQSTIEQLLVDGKLLDGEEAARLRRDAEAVLDAPSIPGYVVIAKLGQGGFGAVYKAVQQSMDRLVALKILPPDRAKDQTFIDRFYREARSSGKLDHSNVVRGYDVGEASGLHYFAMEFVDGQSVEKWLGQLGRFSVADAVKITYDVACALVHAQEHNLVHRDIKPDNIMITKKGVVKLADLGLAKQLDEQAQLTQTGSGFGTPFYMPPEQARNAKYVDGRSDIYALGATLYRLVTGKLPYTGETALEIITAKEKGTHPKASALNPAVPAPLNLVLDKMMSREPGHRYQTAAELVAELDRLGLHGSQLSFIEGSAKSEQPTASHLTSRAHHAKPTQPHKAEKKTATAKAPNQPTVGDATLWFVKFRDDNSKEVKVRLQTDRIRELIKGGQLDETAEASHSPKGPFRKLATYEEFERLLLGQIAQKRAETRAPRTSHKLADLIQNIEKEQRWYKIRKRIRETGHVFLTWVLAAVILVVGGYAIWTYVIHPNWSKVPGQTAPAQPAAPAPQAGS
jgi:serine/threonine-protein kinase